MYGGHLLQLHFKEINIMLPLLIGLVGLLGYSLFKKKKLCISSIFTFPIHPFRLICWGIGKVVSYTEQVHVSYQLYILLEGNTAK